MNLFSELKRRKVFRVAVVYAATAFAVLQGADVLLPNLGVPDWVMPFLSALVVLGFPIAMVLAWALELRPDGSIHRTEPAEPGGTDIPLLGRKTILAAAALIVLGVGLSAGWMLKSDTQSMITGTTPSAEPESSIAVLPFVNMSGNADNEYFSDGLTETLLHKLAQVAELKVAARTSSFAFKDQNRDIREIAATLGVANVLEGSVQRAGDRVRITAQLIQADDGYHIWSQVFDRSLDDIFAVQDDIAVQVASALRGSLLAEDVVAETGGTDNLEAYDLYLQGRAALYDRNAERLDDAVRLMRRAIALDPGFALAWAGLSEALEEQAVFTGQNLQRQDLGENSEVMEAARTAVRLAPDNARLRARLGLVLMDRTADLAAARQQLDRALALDPQEPFALTVMSRLLWSKSRAEEALEFAERAMALDPLDLALKVESVNKYMTVGRPADAERLARSIIEQDPGYVPGLQALGNVYWRTGRHVEAFRVYHRLLQINPRTAYIIERIARSFQNLGDLDGARRWLDRAADINPDSATLDRAQLLWLGGQSDEAIEIYKREVERARENGTLVDRPWIAINLASMREDWDGMYTLARRRLDTAEETQQLWLVNWVRGDLALAADRLGRTEERDRLADAMLDNLRTRLDDGEDTQYTWMDIAEAHALLGDAEAAADALNRAFERGFRRRLEVLNDPVFAGVVADPEFQRVLARIEARNRGDRQRLLEAEQDLGDFEGSE